MRLNSLAFRLFVTAAAWVLVVLPVAGWIIYSRYEHEARIAFDSRIAFFLTVVISDADEQPENAPNAPNNWGEGLFEITHSGWYWQIKPLDGRPVPSCARARCPATTCHCPANSMSSPTSARCAGAT